MTTLILVLVLVFLFLAYSRFIIYSLFHLPTVSKFIFKDLYKYIKYKKYNNFTNYGVITMYTASGTQVFGSGKTLSMVKDVIRIYKQYNNKLVWDENLEQFVTQQIHIISNVELKEVPYIKFNSVNQFVDIEKYGFNRWDITLYVLDESGAIFNSREFRSNVPSEMLTRLLQSRKNKCCLFMTSQRLGFTDKILRQICCVVYECSKKWRFVVLKAYNPLDLEYAYNPELIKPKTSMIYFCTDALYNMYNTYQLIEDLNKKYTPISDKEVLDSYGTTQGDINLVNPRKLKKFVKGGKK